MKAVRIPRSIDDYPQFLLWSLDEMVPIMLGLVLGILFNYPISGLISGLVISKIYSRIKNGKSDGYLNHISWRYLMLPVFKGKVFTEPFLKRMIP